MKISDPGAPSRLRPIDKDVADNTACPVARAQAILGERWTLVILRELFLGNDRFEAIQAQSGTTPQMLATRLKKLEVEGLVERRRCPGSPGRLSYFLTRRGQELYPVMLALRGWGERWLKSDDEKVAIDLVHKPCGADPGFGTTCQNCGEDLRREDMLSSLGSDFAEERERKATEFRSK